MNKSIFDGRLPKVGDAIIYFPDESDSKARNNYAQFIPGIITMTHGWTPEGVVNIKLFPDDAGVLWRTSRSHAMGTAVWQLNSPGTEKKFCSNLNDESPAWIYKEEFDLAMDLFNASF